MKKALVVLTSVILLLTAACNDTVESEQQITTETTSEATVITSEEIIVTTEITETSETSETTNNIFSIEPQETEIELELSSADKNQYSSFFVVKASNPDAIDLESINLVSEDPSIVTIEYDTSSSEDKLCYLVTGVSVGDTFIYAATADGLVSSEKISVKVKEAAPSPTPEPEPTERTVWISKSGKKYHNKSTCSNMKSPSEVTLSYAESKGYTPCKKCFK